jgi:hypothetical protein
MESLFIKYDQALELKELGFDEPCLGIHYKEGLNPSFMVASQYGEHGATANGGILAPTFSQVFKFFRDKYDLYYTIEGSKKYGFAFFIYYENDDKDELKSKEYSAYEEAEHECIVKLIEITKENK